MDQRTACSWFQRYYFLCSTQRCPTLSCSNAHVPYASWIHVIIKLFSFDLVLSKIDSCACPKLGLCCCVLPVTSSDIDQLMKKMNSLIFWTFKWEYWMTLHGTAMEFKYIKREFEFNSTIEWTLIFFKIRCKLVKKVLKICSWISF